MISYSCYAIRDSEGGQAVARIESFYVYYLHIVCKIDRFQFGTISESAILYSRYAIRECDGGQTYAIKKRSYSNARHAIWDSD